MQTQSENIQHRIKKHTTNVSHFPQLEVTHCLKHSIYLGISKLFAAITGVFFLKTCQGITFQITGLYS